MLVYIVLGLLILFLLSRAGRYNDNVPCEQTPPYVESKLSCEPTHEPASLTETTTPYFKKSLPTVHKMAEEGYDVLAQLAPNMTVHDCVRMAQLSEQERFGVQYLDGRYQRV